MLAMPAFSATDYEPWMATAVDVAVEQLKATAIRLHPTGKIPRSLYTDYSLEQLSWQLEVPPTKFKIALGAHPSIDAYRTLRLADYDDWTSGFFPGSLWLAYELSGDETLRQEAVHYTNLLLPVSKLRDTHDLGFMVNCSFGNALRLAPNDSIKNVLVETADNLISRFNPGIGCIRSWDFGEWNYPVIIDNMMNLELLFNAERLTGNKKYTDIAVTHAVTTLNNHFRKDFTTFHVVSYNNDGSVESQGTFQGKNDDSAWARGQGWAIYGFTECFRETGRREFLNQAVAVADMIMARVTTADKIPYWDFDAPASDITPRDASAAAVIASGMLELSYILAEKGKPYFDYATSILKSLASPAYLAPKGTNEGFLLMHSVGSLPHGSEIDTPINYADYYFLEALIRYHRIAKGLYPAELNVAK